MPLSIKDRLIIKFGEFGTSILRLLPPELAHDIGLWLMKNGLMEKMPCPTFSEHLSSVSVSIPGLGDLVHPIGLAAGFDKDCVCPKAFVRMGFSFLEMGTVTPLPQPGNPKPRLFRYPEQQTLINRMGFGSDGVITVSKRLENLDWDHEKVPLGISIGKNRNTPQEHAAEDFLKVFEKLKPLAKFLVFNISSPNTVGLRDLETEDFINYLAERIRVDLNKIWLKLDPDLSKDKFQKLIEAIVDKGFQGVVLTNTHRVDWPEKGGQSGHALATLSATRLEWAYEVHKGALPMIASGGILSGIDIFERLARGAGAIQIYTALVYRGPWVVVSLLTEFIAEMKLRGFQTAKDIIGSFYEK